MKTKRKNNQQGFTLIEVLIAVAILAVVSGAILSAVDVSSRASALNAERTTAESITKTQLEYIMKIDYDAVAPFEYGIIPGIPSGYSIAPISEASGNLVILDTLGDGTGTSDTNYGVHDTDPLTRDDDYDDVHKISVKVFHNGKLVMTTQAYKVKYE